MARSLIKLNLIILASSSVALAGEGATEDFEVGFANGQPLRIHNGWFYEEQNDTPVVYKGGGFDNGWGIAPGTRAFTWTAKGFVWDPNPRLVAVVVGGDWQTDSDGMLDDDRAGWTVSNDDDESGNIFGVQIDPLDPPPNNDQPQQFESPEDAKLNIEAYWDGEAGDDSGRAKILELPELEPNTWYRMRAKFTKLTANAVKIDVSFVELNDEGQPEGVVLRGTLGNTSELPDTPGNRKPNSLYFTATQVWPVYKNFSNRRGGFDNAYFALELADEDAEPAGDSDGEDEDEEDDDDEDDDEASTGADE